MKSNFKFNLTSSKLYNLLLVAVLIFSSCKQSEKENITSIIKEINQRHDSITISVNFKKRELVALNFIDENLKTSPLEFLNKDSKDTIITKKIPKLQYSQIIKYFYGKGFGLTKGTSQHFLIDSTISKISFYLSENKALRPIEPKNIELDEGLFRDYLQLWIKIYKVKESGKKQLIKELDTLYQFYNKKYPLKEKPYQAQINDLQYMSHLEYLDPLNNKVDNYVKSINLNVIGGPLSGLMKNYIEHRIISFDYPNLNPNNYSPQYIEFLSMGIFRFLRAQENKGDIEYQPAADWLKTTDFYKNNKVLIDNNTTPFDNEVFKKLLNEMNLLDKTYKEITFSEIVQHNPSKYYLIDFWATWCAPCIKGVEKMNKMEFPKTISVVSFSVDKLKDKAKWKLKTKELNQKISCLVDNRLVENRNFLKFIELQSIPRYILIDKELNLVDRAFLSPHEPDFLRKLNQLK